MSEKTVAQKLFVKNAGAIAVINADAGQAALLAELPAALMAGDGQAADLIVLFVNGRQELEDLLPAAKTRLLPKGALWVAYRKGGAKREIHRDSIAAHAETIGLEPVAIISLDADWSCLRLKPL
jgi:hypothetical protein